MDRSSHAYQKDAGSNQSADISLVRIQLKSAMLSYYFCGVDRTVLRLKRSLISVKLNDQSKLRNLRKRPNKTNSRNRKRVYIPIFRPRIASRL